ncbi:hypothetical protein ACRAWD_14130 [Caulobacter segnis]
MEAAERQAGRCPRQGRRRDRQGWPLPETVPEHGAASRKGHSRLAGSPARRRSGRRGDRDE